MTRGRIIYGLNQGLLYSAKPNYRGLLKTDIRSHKYTNNNNICFTCIAQNIHFYALKKYVFLKANTLISFMDRPTPRKVVPSPGG